MARGPARNPRLLAAVERMLLDFEPPTRIRAEMVRRFKVSPRTVTSYIQLADDARAIDERAHARHRRPRARATASAAMARALIRAQKLCDEADDLLRKANRYETEVHKALEAGDIDDLNGPSGGGETKLQIEGGEIRVDEPTDPERKRVQTRLRSKSSLARGYRHAAMEMLKRAEVAEQRADAWFSQFAKVSGIYEPEVIVVDSASSLVTMTSAQRREREADLLKKLKDSIAKVKAREEKRTAAKAEGAPGAT